jgi:hypothetical protein
MIDPKARPVSQKKRKLGEQRRRVVKHESEGLLKAGFIREI